MKIGVQTSTNLKASNSFSEYAENNDLIFPRKKWTPLNQYLVTHDRIISPSEPRIYLFALYITYLNRLAVPHNYLKEVPQMRRAVNKD